MKRTWKDRFLLWVQILVIVILYSYLKDNIRLPQIDWSNPVMLFIAAFVGGIVVCLVIVSVMKKFKK